MYGIVWHMEGLKYDNLKFVNSQRSRSFSLKLVIFFHKAKHFEHLHDQNCISVSTSSSGKSNLHCYMSYTKH